MSLDILVGFGPTAQGLHKAAQLVAAFRILELEPAPLYLEQALRVCPEGLSSDILQSGLQVTLDFKQTAIVISEPDDNTVVVPLSGHSQASLFEEALGAISSAGLAGIAQGQRTNALIDAIRAKGRRSIPRLADYADTAPLAVDRHTAAGYADALYGIFTAIARFRARLKGHMSPLVVWPEHFDLSFLWFATETISESSPHMNFGFAPFSPGFERPYLYAYAYPLKPGYQTPALPQPAYWNMSPWTGAVLKYDDIRNTTDPLAFVEAACLGIFQAQLKILQTG